MSHIGPLIRAWRSSRNCADTALATRGGIPLSVLEDIEAEKVDPPHSVLQALADGLGIPLSWLFVHPSQMDLLCKEDEDDGGFLNSIEGADPVVERILRAADHDRTLFVLVTALLQSGDPKLLRAAEVSLRSLVKQSKQATVPWQSRPPGHFEPPSD